MRFTVFERELDFENKSVLDLGCGYGDLAHFLNVRQRLRHYTGVDFHKSFIKQARLGASNTMHFQHGNFSQMKLPKHDIVIASGSLNYQSSDKHYLQKAILVGYKASNEAFGFNLLNSEFFREDRLLKAHHLSDVISICRQLTDKVQVIDDYMPEDFTIILRKS
nr:class I SAM-dependent methyltransferase [Vibrio sp. S9_S30]